jgi:LCP family protein required for cell wall assembly
MEDYEAYGQLRDRPATAPRLDRPEASATTAPQVGPLPGAAPPLAKPKRSHWLRNIVLVIVAYFVLALGTMVQPIPVPFTSMRVAVPFPGGPALMFGLPNRPFTVLVVGVDLRPAQSGPTRTDTILLLRLDPNSDDASFLSIPRDSLMQVPMPDGSVTQDRINTAFVYNYSAEDSGAGPRALMDTIERNLGIHVDYYVVFDQRSAADLIDAMGGVTINNPREFGQANYSDDDVNVVPQHFPAGELHLNGYEAVAYGRIREGSTDFDRIERQQRVAAALMARAASPGSLLRIPSIYSSFKKTIDTNLSTRQSAGVLSLLKRVNDDDLTTKSLGDAAVSCASCSASIQLLDPVKTQEIVAEAFGAEAGERAAALLVQAGVTP